MALRLFCDNCGLEIDRGDDVPGFSINIRGIDNRNGEKQYFIGQFHVCSRDCMHDLVSTGGVLESEEGEWSQLFTESAEASD